MGFGGISIWQLLIVLAIIVLLFGTKKLRGMGSDLGGAVKGFKKAISDEQDSDKDKSKDKEQAEVEPEQIQKSENVSATDTKTEKNKDDDKV